MLEIKNTTKYYGNYRALNNLNIKVNDGEIFGLLGENGAGKTTTFRIILQLINANEGEVLLDGEKIDFNTTDKIGFVTEERSLLTKLTVKEQLLFYGNLKRMKDKDIIEKSKYWLEKFDIPNYMDRKIKELSKGNQQKIQFISAIINEPKLLILDEPFTGLDPINVKLMKDAIYTLKEKGCSIIFSSHQMEYIEEFCEKLVILVKGDTILDGYVKDIKKSFGHKNILLKGENINIEKIKKIKGVTEVITNANSYIIKLENSDISKLVFNEVKKSDITTYDLLEPTISEIFIQKVGELNEK